GVCSWFDFAKEVLNQAGRSAIPVRPITASEIARPAKRPANSVLSSDGLRRYSVTVRHWKEAVPVYLEDLREVGKLT
ncbi:MAG: sugar nucleotide-binding protein, partial [Candidatus Acidiferrum sp.]